MIAFCNGGVAKRRKDKCYRQKHSRGYRHYYKKDFEK